MSDPTAETIRRRARWRLEGLRVPAVGIVDAGANQRPFFEIRKAAMSDTAVAKNLALPAAAKETFAKAIAACVEKLLALNSMLDTATVDEAAAVPPELTDAVRGAGQELTALAEQFAPAAAAPAEVAPTQEMTLAKELIAMVEKAAPRMPLQAFHKLNTRAMDVVMGLLQEFAPHFGGGESIGPAVAPAAVESSAPASVDIADITKSAASDVEKALTARFDELQKNFDFIATGLGLMSRSRQASNADASEEVNKAEQQQSQAPVDGSLSRRVRTQLGRE